jgi:hypothetical protein
MERHVERQEGQVGQVGDAVGRTCAPAAEAENAAAVGGGAGLHCWSVGWCSVWSREGKTRAPVVNKVPRQTRINTRPWNLSDVRKSLSGYCLFLIKKHFTRSILLVYKANQLAGKHTRYIYMYAREREREGKRRMISANACTWGEKERICMCMHTISNTEKIILSKSSIQIKIWWHSCARFN